MSDSVSELRGGDAGVGVTPEFLAEFDRLAARTSPPPPEPPAELPLVQLEPTWAFLLGRRITEENLDAACVMFDGAYTGAGQEFVVKNTSGQVTHVGPGDVVVRIPEGLLVIYADEIGPARPWQVTS